MQFQFENFVLDTERFQLESDDLLIRTEPQVLELIIFLLKNQGRLISRDELNKNIWDSRIVSESALSTRIKLARQALGDDGREQKYIRTVHKKGFIFNPDIQITKQVETSEVELEKESAVGLDWHSISVNPKPTISVIKFSNLNSDPDKQLHRRWNNGRHHDRAFENV